MEKTKKFLSFISNRVVIWAVFALVVLIFGVISYVNPIYIFTDVPLGMIVIVLGILLLIIGGWFGIVEPYKVWVKQVSRFLDGYLPLHAISGQVAVLTPYTLAEIQKIDDILNSTQVVNLNKRQAQYLALQNQINPHFLYNTLDGIRSEALIAGVDSVADMTEALAAFFRYTISKVENLVTVEEELNNCKTYFKIQQYRFGERLKLHIAYDEEDYEEILHFMLPKLTLQPILENSIIHGTELKIGTGNLTIHLQRTAYRLIITISDDGVGMDEETLETLNQKLGRNAEHFTKEEQEKQGGIALVNVNNRIHLIFGEEFGMHVYSMQGVGTDVEITVPIVKSDREIKNRGVLR